MVNTVFDNDFALGEDFQLSSSSEREQADVSFAALPGGGIVAVWRDEDGYNDLGIRAQIFDSYGIRIGEEFAVNLMTTGVQASPSVEALPTGGFVVTWTDESAGYPAGFDVHGQIFDANGARVGAEFVVNSSTDGFQTEPFVTALANGGFVITGRMLKTPPTTTLGRRSSPPTARRSAAKSLLPTHCRATRHHPPSPL